MAIACLWEDESDPMEGCAHDNLEECLPYECGVQIFKWLEKHYKVATANERSKHGEVRDVPMHAFLPPRSPSPLTARFTILFHTAWPQCAEENMLPMASDAWVPPCCHSGYSTVSVLMGGDAWR